jgi:hypothetical protein
MTSWWASKVRQFAGHVGASVRADEVRALGTWLTPPQLALFGSMPRADQRHGLDVVARLRSDGAADPDLLLAGLLHDAGKGRSVRLWHRVGWSLGERYGRGARGAFERLPGFAAAFDRMRRHAELSSALALEAGCSARTAELIRAQEAPVDAAGEALRRADEAS